MTDKTTKKTVAKASAGKQVKAVEAKAAEAKPLKGKEGEAKPVAKTRAKAASAKPAASPADGVPQVPVASPEAAPVVAPEASKAAKPKASAPASRSKAADTLPPLALAPSWEDVARRAFEIFEREGHAHGNDQDHWYRAESELRGQPLGA